MERLIFSILTLLLFLNFAFSHPGGVDSSGGHFHSTTHQYDCHRDTCVPIPTDATSHIPKNTKPTLGPISTHTALETQSLVLAYR